MKILLASDMYENQINGVSGSVITLRDELRKKGHDVRVLSLSKTKESKMVKTDYLIGSFSVPLYPDVRQTLKFRDPLIKDIIKWNPDIVHIQTEFSIHKIAKKIVKKCKCPYVTTCHTFWEDYTSYLIPSKKIGKAIARKVVKHANKGSKAIIIPTEKMRGILDGYGIKIDQYAIPTGIDLSRFQKKYSQNEKDALKEKLNIPKKAKILISLGRVAKEKNIDELVEFLPSLVKKDKDIILIIAGDGPYKKNIEDKVKELKMEDYVRFTGMVEPKNTYKYYGLGDVFVCSSTSETQGITYIEAQACGTPLICRYDKCLDNVLFDGENGYFFKNEKEYVDKVLKVLDDSKLRNNMKKKSLKLIDNFSKEKFGDKVEELYINVINEAKKGSVK